MDINSGQQDQGLQQGQDGASTGQPGQQDQGLQQDTVLNRGAEGAPSSGTQGLGAPDRYGPWTLPENLDAEDPVVAAALGEAEPIFREMGLNQAQAQKLIDLHMKHYMGGLAESQEIFEQELRRKVALWGKQIEGDPEFGGVHLQESLGHARRAINELGGTGLDRALRETGAINRPEIFAAFVRAGRRFQEDRFVQGESGPRRRGDSLDDLAERLYPDMVRGH